MIVFHFLCGKFGYLLKTKYFESILSPPHRMLKWKMSRSYVRICPNSIGLWMWDVALSGGWLWFFFFFFSSKIPMYCSSVLWLKPMVTNPSLHTLQMWNTFISFVSPEVIWKVCQYLCLFHPQLTLNLCSKRATIFTFCGGRAAVS